MVRPLSCHIIISHVRVLWVHCRCAHNADYSEGVNKIDLNQNKLYCDLVKVQNKSVSIHNIFIMEYSLSCQANKGNGKLNFITNEVCHFRSISNVQLPTTFFSLSFIFPIR